MGKLIFLSHIHEEAQLAQIIQQAIEDEFSGFVEVFVSSDGKTIPAGANFLKRIESGLMDCIGALYLISPTSVKRNWVNFELGAVWIRNSISVKSGGDEIPTIPICHSGVTPSTLPMPLINLTAIQAANAGQLELAFKSIQAAVGGKGKLKTDFDMLAKKVHAFEQEYTLGANWVALFKAIGVSNSDINKVIEGCVSTGRGKGFELKLGFRDNMVFQALKQLEGNGLAGRMSVRMENSGLQISSTQGTSTGGEITVTIKTDDIIEFRTLLTQSIQ